MPKKKKAVGHRVRHTTDRMACRVTPIMSKPIPTPPGQKPKICPTCQIHHPVKCLHIWIEPDGSALISQGVLEMLQGVGMDGFVLEGATEKPPPLQIGTGKTRPAMDNANRAQVIYSMQLGKALTNG